MIIWICACLRACVFLFVCLSVWECECVCVLLRALGMSVGPSIGWAPPWICTIVSEVVLLHWNDANKRNNNTQTEEYTHTQTHSHPHKQIGEQIHTPTLTHTQRHTQCPTNRHNTEIALSWTGERNLFWIFPGRVTPRCTFVKAVGQGQNTYFYTYTYNKL